MHEKPKHYSPNKEYDLYAAYTEAESIYKTNWDNITPEEKLDYLERLQNEGFKPVHRGAAMEQTVGEFKERYDEEVNKNTFNEIPFAKDLKSQNRRSPEFTPPKRGPNGAAERVPPVKRNINVRRPEPEVMTKEEEKTKFSLKNVVSYLRAEQSLATQGPVSLKVFEERKKICGECPHRKTHDKIPDPLGFCTKCGCGANPRARLTNKIKMPQTSCPLNKWGTSTGIYKGVMGKIRHKLTSKSKREELDYT